MDSSDNLTDCHRLGRSKCELGRLSGLNPFREKPAAGSQVQISFYWVCVQTDIPRILVRKRLVVCGIHRAHLFRSDRTDIQIVHECHVCCCFAVASKKHKVLIVEL
jgi:hypothetical protein